MHVLVIGAGPSGLHFSLTALEKGHKVTMVDVGNKVAPPPLPQSDFIGLKRELSDPVEYFLGSDYGGAVLPPPPGTDATEFYGLPPSKDPVFLQPDQYSFIGKGFSPLHSFAAGGLAECWTGGSYALGDHDLEKFPLDYDELAPFYSEVASRIGVAGVADDLSDHFLMHDNLADPISLDRSSSILLGKYESKRHLLRSKHPVLMGRSRQAALSSRLGEREGCSLCGRCLWGCPNGAFYTPSYTLKECLIYPNFTYESGLFASHFTVSATGEIKRLTAVPVNGGKERAMKADRYVLASGALSTSNIVLRTIWKQRGEKPELTGLMDNRQILAPFLNLPMIGKTYDPNSYQYHQLALVADLISSKDQVHGQITTLTTASAHPVMQQLPVDYNTGRYIFQSLRSALGVINLNFSDYRRPDNSVYLDPDQQDQFGWPILRLQYQPAPNEKQKLKESLRIIGRFMRSIHAPLIPGMAHVRPMGSSVHYAGTLPMSNESRELTVSPDCVSHDYGNLLIVDGSVMPDLPAKNLTFTLMANAVRAASKIL